MYCQVIKKHYLCSRKLRDGAVAARWAHNPKVVSSSLAPATNKKVKPSWLDLFFLSFAMIFQPAVAGFNYNVYFC